MTFLENFADNKTSTAAACIDDQRENLEKQRLSKCRGHLVDVNETSGSMAISPNADYTAVFCFGPR